MNEKESNIEIIVAVSFFYKNDIHSKLNITYNFQFN